MLEIPETGGGDVHGLEFVAEADLSLFFAGNQFPVVPELLEEFCRGRPGIRNVFYETLPPGLLAAQIRAGEALYRGELLRVRADVYLSTLAETMDGLACDGFLDDAEVRPYAKNRLALLVTAGNPKGIRGLADLARDEVRISMPDPDNEGIATPILRMYRDYGGEEFERVVMETKRRAGTTALTTVHHRETPQRLESDQADVGPVWFTEYRHARATGRQIELVEVGEKYDQRENVTYYAAPLRGAPNPRAARDFVDFLLSREGQEIYARYGFLPVRGADPHQT